jgi:hypothetical protein
MRRYLKNMYNNWQDSRQISVCSEILGRHSHHLGPEHQKEIRHLMSEIQSRRSNRNLM